MRKIVALIWALGFGVTAIILYACGVVNTAGFSLILAFAFFGGLCILRFEAIKIIKGLGFHITFASVAITIIGVIIVATVIPIIRSGTDAAKWSEGRAMMGTIATALRAYCAEASSDFVDLTCLELGEDLGFRTGDLNGTYFKESDFSIQSGSYDNMNKQLDFTIQGNKENETYILNQDGMWAPSEL